MLTPAARSWTQTSCVSRSEDECLEWSTNHEALPQSSLVFLPVFVYLLNTIAASLIQGTSVPVPFVNEPLSLCTYIHWSIWWMMAMYCILSEHNWMAPSIRRAIGVSTLFAFVNGYVEFPSSCIGEEDGYQWIKPLEGNDYPAINQKCDDEFMIIDVNRDDNVKAYFSSFDSWHYALSGILREALHWLTECEQMPFSECTSHCILCPTSWQSERCDVIRVNVVIRSETESLCVLYRSFNSLNESIHWMHSLKAFKQFI